LFIIKHFQKKLLGLIFLAFAAPSFSVLESLGFATNEVAQMLALFSASLEGNSFSRRDFERLLLADSNLLRTDHLHIAQPSDLQPVIQAADAVREAIAPTSLTFFEPSFWGDWMELPGMDGAMGLEENTSPLGNNCAGHVIDPVRYDPTLGARVVRQRMVEDLMRLQNDPQARGLMAIEIVNALRLIYLKEGVDAVQHFLANVPEGIRDDFIHLLERMMAQVTTPSEAEDFFQKLVGQASTQAFYTAYVENFLGRVLYHPDSPTTPTFEPLGYEIIDNRELAGSIAVLARARRVNLTLFQRAYNAETDERDGALMPVGRYVHAEGNPTRYAVHANLDHFNALRIDGEVLKGFCIRRDLCKADDADGFVKEIFSDKYKLHDQKFECQSLFELAVKARSLDVVKLLVKHGGMPQWDCLSPCFYNIPTFLFTYLLVFPCRCTPDFFELAAFLAKSCGWVGALSIQGSSGPVVIRLIKKNPDDALKRLKFLREHGAGVDFKKDPLISIEDFGTPLLAAIQVGRKDIIEFFVNDCGADVNFTDSHGHTPLMLACKKLDLGTVSLLLAHDANPELESHEHAMEPRDAMFYLMMDEVLSPFLDNFCSIFAEIYNIMSPEYAATLDAKYKDHSLYQEAKESMCARFNKKKSARKVTS
jgi:ankyrin repeat protein